MLMIQSGRAGSGGFSLGTGVSYPCCSVLGMEESTDQTTGRAAELIDALVLHHRELSKAQARCAALMMEFSETRSACDRQVIADRRAAGVDPRYKAGEFAGTEISMALRESKHSVQHTMVIARQLRKDTPDAWDAWQAGDITYDKAERISRTLGKLIRENSKALLNHVVVDVAVCKTGELLGRWLNQFVARVEPDEQDERIHRSLADRYDSAPGPGRGELPERGVVVVRRRVDRPGADRDRRGQHPGRHQDVAAASGRRAGRCAVGSDQQRLPHPLGRPRRRPRGQRPGRQRR